MSLFKSLCSDLMKDVKLVDELWKEAKLSKLQPKKQENKTKFGSSRRARVELQRLTKRVNTITRK